MDDIIGFLAKRSFEKRAFGRLYGNPYLGGGGSNMGRINSGWGGNYYSGPHPAVLRSMLPIEEARGWNELSTDNQLNQAGATNAQLQNPLFDTATGVGEHSFRDVIDTDPHEKHVADLNNDARLQIGSEGSQSAMAIQQQLDALAKEEEAHRARSLTSRKKELEAREAWERYSNQGRMWRGWENLTGAGANYGPAMERAHLEHTATQQAVDAELQRIAAQRAHWMQLREGALQNSGYTAGVGNDLANASAGRLARGAEKNKQLQNAQSIGAGAINEAKDIGSHRIRNPTTPGMIPSPLPKSPSPVTPPSATPPVGQTPLRPPALQPITPILSPKFLSASARQPGNILDTLARSAAEKMAVDALDDLNDPSKHPVLSTVKSISRSMPGPVAAPAHAMDMVNEASKGHLGGTVHNAAQLALSVVPGGGLLKGVLGNPISKMVGDVGAGMYDQSQEAKRPAVQMQQAEQQRLAQEFADFQARHNHKVAAAYAVKMAGPFANTGHFVEQHPGKSIAAATALATAGTYASAKRRKKKEDEEAEQRGFYPKAASFDIHALLGELGHNTGAGLNSLRETIAPRQSLSLPSASVQPAPQVGPMRNAVGSGLDRLVAQIAQHPELTGGAVAGGGMLAAGGAGYGASKMLSGSKPKTKTKEDKKDQGK